MHPANSPTSSGTAPTSVSRGSLRSRQRPCHAAPASCQYVRTTANTIARAKPSLSSAADADARLRAVATPLSTIDRAVVSATSSSISAMFATSVDTFNRVLRDDLQPSTPPRASLLASDPHRLWLSIQYVSSETDAGGGPDPPPTRGQHISRRAAIEEPSHPPPGPRTVGRPRDDTAHPRAIGSRPAAPACPAELPHPRMNRRPWTNRTYVLTLHARTDRASSSP